MSFATLVRALADRGRAIGDWSAHGREVTRVEVEDGVTRRLERAELAARLHVDGPTGRGSADVAVDGEREGFAIAARVEEAIARAAVSIGPGWRARPPGAPARVSLAEQGAVDGEKVAGELLRTLAREARAAGAELVEARAIVEVARVRVETARGLAATWTETWLEYEARVAAGGATAVATQAARRRATLRPADRIAGAVRRAKGRASAGATPTGRHAVLLPAELLGGAGIAILDGIAALADAATHRRGLARVRLGAPIAPGAESAPEPLDVTSDGTLPWGLRSAPLGVRGEPVRRFPIVTRGALAGLALDEREAALRGVPPNGGVRNLVVGAGASDAAALRAGDALELLELTHVDLEPLTGRGALGIGLAVRRAGGVETLVTGGEVQGDLVAALARSRRSSATVRAGAYVGPRLVLVPDLDVV